jgi:formate--tetrahydrofolate ligase
VAESGFDITPASEIMAIMCFATSIDDLKRRIGNILLGFNYDNKPFYVKDLGVEGAITVLLKDALSPTSCRPPRVPRHSSTAVRLPI